MLLVVSQLLHFLLHLHLIDLLLFQPQSRYPLLAFLQLLFALWTDLLLSPGRLLHLQSFVDDVDSIGRLLQRVSSCLALPQFGQVGLVCRLLCRLISSCVLGMLNVLMLVVGSGLRAFVNGVWMHLTLERPQF